VTDNGKMIARELLEKYRDGVRDFRRLDLSGEELTDANLSGADLSDADLRRANLFGAKLFRTDLSGADLSDADLRRANLFGAKLFRANLTGALLTGSDMSHANLEFANLSDAVLVCNLEHAYLGGANLSRANLTGANLSRADLSSADLTGANLSRAELSYAILDSADLTSANLTGANLSSTSFRSAKLERASFRGTRSLADIWADVDLASAEDLETMRHDGPSTVGIDTLLRSGGRIPDAFLRGCGVPETVIEQQKALIGAVAPIQFYSCFISYSHTDDEFAKRLHGRLQQGGLRVWFAPEEMKAGRKLHEQIDEAIRVHDKLLLVLSPASMASAWVETEISKARKRERKEGRQVLFPIGLVDFATIEEWECFDAGAGKDSAREIREYYIPDFSNWKDHDAFESAFARLLRDLRASAD
jgi:uncharacterized protein YjbI with pentapeptide repeats